MRGRLFLATCLALFPLLLRADGTAVTVTVTQRAPIETIDSTGAVQGVNEATVGMKYTFVSAAGNQLVLQDAQATHYQIAVSATDYTPSVATPTPSPSTVLAPTTNPPPTAATTTNSAAAVATATNAAPVQHRQFTPVSPLDAATTVPQAGEAFTFTLDDRPKDNKVAVYPQGGIAGRPLLIAAHAEAGTGPEEIQGWMALAKTHNFTVVCPTLLTSNNSSGIEGDTSYFQHVLHWIENNLQYDKDNVYMTGSHGGGAATWYLATRHPDFIHGLFIESGDFWDNIADFSLSGWADRPIEVTWDSDDSADTVTQGQKALDALKDASCTNVIHSVVEDPNPTHKEHYDLVVKWMDAQVAGAPASPSN